MAPGRGGGQEELCEWQGLQPKLHPASRGLDFSNARQEFRVFMYNRLFSFEIWNELTSRALYKKRIVNLFP